MREVDREPGKRGPVSHEESSPVFVDGVVPIFERVMVKTASGAAGGMMMGIHGGSGDVDGREFDFTFGISGTIEVNFAPADGEEEGRTFYVAVHDVVRALGAKLGPAKAPAKKRRRKT